MRELLIVGIDPGTTVGYAVLDVKGNVLKTRSSKLLELNSLMEEITSLGNVLAVGTDKARCPSLIEKFAAKTGARIMVPEEDLAVLDKDEITSGFETGNAHEKDALAAALFAYKTLEPLLRRIGKALEEAGKQELFREVTAIVVMDGINIKDALLSLENSERRESKKEIVVAETAVVAEKPEKEAMLEMQMKRLERENAILKDYSSKLVARMKSLNRELRRNSRKKIAAAGNDVTAHRDELAKKMQGIIDGKERQVIALKKEQAILERIIGSGGIAVRKVKALGFDDISGLGENSTILAGRVDGFSERAVSYLKEKNITVMTRANIPNALRQLGVTVVKAEGLVLVESEKWAAADARKLAEARKAAEGKNVLGLIESYKEERKYQMM